MHASSDRLRAATPAWSLSLAAVLLTGCGAAGTETGSGPESGPSTVTSDAASGEPDDRCAAVLSDDVMTELGWSASGTAVEGAGGRCERGGDGRFLVVGADPTVRPDAGPDRVERAYARACAALSAEGEAVPEQDPEWLGLESGRTACVRGLGPDRSGGLIQVYTLSDAGWLVQAQVTDDRETSLEALRAGVAVLVDRATAGDWS